MEKATISSIYVAGIDKIVKTIKELVYFVLLLDHRDQS